MVEISDLRDPLPTPARLREIREAMGLSQMELASALGFGPNGAKTVRDWEAGKRASEPFRPTPTAWAAMRYLASIVSALKPYESIPDGDYDVLDNAAHEAMRKLRSSLPEFMR